MNVNPNYSDNFSELLKDSNFIQIIEPKLLEKYNNKIKKVDVSSDGSFIEDSNLDPHVNYMEGVFSYT
jgi:hypothetical protein